MTTRQCLDRYADESKEEILVCDGFDDALIGLAEAAFNQPSRAVYSKELMIKVMVERDGMSHDDAVEFLEFNTWGAFVGPGTPIFMTTFKDELDEQEGH